MVMWLRYGEKSFPNIGMSNIYGNVNESVKVKGHSKYGSMMVIWVRYGQKSFSIIGMFLWIGE